MVANVKFFIFAHGNVVHGEEGASYDRPDPVRKIKVKPNASYEDLLNTICTKVDNDIHPPRRQIKVLHRHPKYVGERVHHYLVPIQDDSDVEDLIEMAEKMGEKAIQELYIEISNPCVTFPGQMTQEACTPLYKVAV